MDTDQNATLVDTVAEFFNYITERLDRDQGRRPEDHAIIDGFRRRLASLRRER
jgi:hypothetical protein